MFRRILPVLALLGALILSACGGGSPAAQPSAAPATTTAPAAPAATAAPAASNLSGKITYWTAYLGWHHVERGVIDHARELLAWVESCADAAGNLPEQVAAHLNHPAMLPIWEQRWGKSACPLLWSHAAYITLATHVQ